MYICALTVTFQNKSRIQLLHLNSDTTDTATGNAHTSDPAPDEPVFTVVLEIHREVLSAPFLHASTNRGDAPKSSVAEQRARRTRTRAVAAAKQQSATACDT